MRVGLTVKDLRQILEYAKVYLETNPEKTVSVVLDRDEVDWLLKLVNESLEEHPMDVSL